VGVVDTQRLAPPVTLPLGVALPLPRALALRWWRCDLLIFFCTRCALLVVA
jgi:hypothetical protein